MVIGREQNWGQLQRIAVVIRAGLVVSVQLCGMLCLECIIATSSWRDAILS